jgi:tRNA pseudouridine13 synthase
VPPATWRPPTAESDVGLRFYASTAPGSGGSIKERTDDFRVTEISAYPIPDPEGPFTVLRLASRNWEQHELAARVAQRLGLAPHAIAWAGTKDRRAVAERLFSYRGPPPDRLDLHDVELLEAYRARSGLVLGHHYGNSFAIRVVNEGEEAATRYAAVEAELRAFGGVPNFFGLQRFGEVRPITHAVGRALVRGDPAAAVDLYLTQVLDGEAGPGPEARRAFASHRDPQRALREFPSAYRFERQLLDHLARGQPPVRALHGLPRELRRLFIHAYQAWIFNEWLSRRRERGGSLNRPEPGDVLLRRARDGTIPGTSPIPVAADNRAEALELAERGGAVLAAPLVGFETVLPEGAGADDLLFLLQRENVSPLDFRLPRTPDLASAGSFRPTLVALPPIARRPEPSPDAAPSGDRGTWFRFSLPKGAYATVLLREFTKTGARSL